MSNNNSGAGRVKVENCYGIDIDGNPTVDQYVVRRGTNNRVDVTNHDLTTLTPGFDQAPWYGYTT